MRRRPPRRSLAAAVRRVRSSRAARIRNSGATTNMLRSWIRSAKRDAKVRDDDHAPGEERERRRKHHLAAGDRASGPAPSARSRPRTGSRRDRGRAPPRGRRRNAVLRRRRSPTRRRPRRRRAGRVSGPPRATCARDGEHDAAPRMPYSQRYGHSVVRKPAALDAAIRNGAVTAAAAITTAWVRVSTPARARRRRPRTVRAESGARGARTSASAASRKTG